MEERVKAIGDAADINDFTETANALTRLIENQDDDLEESKQLAMICLGVMVTSMGSQSPDVFFNILKTLIGPHALQHESIPVASTSVIAISSFISIIGPRSIPLIPQCMPVIISLAEKALQDETEASKTLVVSSLGALSVLVESIPLFITSYVGKIVGLLANPKLIDYDSSEVQRAVADLSSVVGSKVEHRSLFPVIVKSVDALMKLGPLSLIRLLTLTDSLLASTKSKSILDFRNEWMSLFLAIFDYQRVMQLDDQDDIDLIEEQVISTFKAYTMKMNEKVFKPIFLKLVEWGLEANAPNYRKVFLYRMCSSLLDTLKSLFVPYVSHVLDALTNTLVSATQGSPIDQEWYYGLSVLRQSFAFDNQEFLSQERFDKILVPLVDQIDLVDAHDNYKESMLEYVVPALKYMAKVRHTDACLKTLNRQVLMKTRSLDPHVRWVALSVISELYSILGEDMLLHFPETIPFLAEVMEDDDEQVENMCKDLCLQIQEHLGEPIEQYFNPQ